MKKPRPGPVGSRRVVAVLALASFASICSCSSSSGNAPPPWQERLERERRHEFESLTVGEQYERCDLVAAYSDEEWREWHVEMVIDGTHWALNLYGWDLNGFDSDDKADIDEYIDLHIQINRELCE